MGLNMNKKFTNGLLGLGAMLLAGQVNATTIFSPLVNADGTFENVNFFYLSNISTNFTLDLFDAGDLSFSKPLNVNMGNTVSFNPGNPGSSSYTATNDITHHSITISTTTPSSDIKPAFILALQDTSSSTWFGDNGVTDVSSGAGTAFFVSFKNPAGDQIVGVDMTLSQVPVPAAVWLFGSGLLGLVGVARRKES